jgi:hypothetical protein
LQLTYSGPSMLQSTSGISVYSDFCCYAHP